MRCSWIIKTCLSVIGESQLVSKTCQIPGVAIVYLCRQSETSVLGDQETGPTAKNVAIVITDGLPFPPSRYQPAIDVAETLRMEAGKLLSLITPLRLNLCCDFN